MRVCDLPQDIQLQLEFGRKALASKHINTAYAVELYNEDGTRYFEAHRCCHSWNDDKGNYMPFGGGTHWSIRYGKVQVREYKSCCNTKEYELVNGKRFGKSANGTEIPTTLATK